jgi:uncharacterized membrane protein
MRFYRAALVGAVVWLATARLGADVRLLLAGDAFFAAFIVAMGVLSMRSRHETFLQRVRQEDEGMVILEMISVVTVIVILGSVFALLDNTNRPSAAVFTLSVASVPLGWFMLHTMFAFHYANVYYSPPPAGEHAGGLSFPGGEDPRAWDFLYFAFVVAMTAQVSDVSVVNTRMRRVTLAHGVISFFFNTVIIAIAVNVTVGLAVR